MKVFNSQGDIEKYVKSEIYSHPRMSCLLSEYPNEAQVLVTDIILRASGVFLWAMLVVRSLIHGLLNYDGISDLRRRLEVFPTELQSLYKHMMEQMEPLYRRQASEYLQIILQSHGVQLHTP